MEEFTENPVCIKCGGKARHRIYNPAYSYRVLFKKFYVKKGFSIYCPCGYSWRTGVKPSLAKELYSSLRG